MFGKAYTMTLNRVHDTVRIKEGKESLTLRVDADSMKMVAGISAVQNELKSITDNTPAEESFRIAKDFARVIFGEDGCGKLCEFYRDDAGCIIGLCAQYFSKRLKNLIAKTQRKIRR